MSQMEVKMEVRLTDLPVLPFEKILSYLGLEDRLKSRAVSRRWYQTIDSLKKVNSLCYSERPMGFSAKSRFVTGAYAKNFISSTKIKSFFETFGQSILANLKHLSLYELNAENMPAIIPVLNSFG